MLLRVYKTALTPASNKLETEARAVLFSEKPGCRRKIHLINSCFSSRGRSIRRCRY